MHLPLWANVNATELALYRFGPTSFHAPCPPLRTGCVSPLRKNVPSEENVSRFLPTPLALLTVTSHAPTNVGLDVTTRFGELPDVVASRLAQDEKKVTLA